MAPSEAHGGFSEWQKRSVADCLRRVERAACRQLEVQSARLIARARIPVLKLHLLGGLELDCSLNDDAGCRAASYVASMMRDYACLQPLCRLLKALLKQRGLADVASGGLGGWSLVNCIIAQLLEADKASRPGQQADHLGEMLVGFLDRFGLHFANARDAVAIAQGGIVPRSQLARVAQTTQAGSLIVCDPLTGREVAGGSHRIADVQALFARLARRLADAREQAAASSSGGSRPGGAGGGSGGGACRGQGVFEYGDEDEWAAGSGSPTQRHRASRGDGAAESFPTLALLLDTRAALERPGARLPHAGAAARAPAAGPGAAARAGGSSSRGVSTGGQGYQEGWPWSQGSRREAAAAQSVDSRKHGRW